MPKPESLGEFEQSVLLAIVQLGDGAYGVTIRQEIERRTGREIAIGALYTALDRLERKHYVSSEMSAPTAARGGRSRRHFAVRPAGATALQQSRDYLNRMWDGLAADLTRSRS
jgi:DNA-binding PadR family transcriptional regulator